MKNINIAGKCQQKIKKSNEKKNRVKIYKKMNQNKLKNRKKQQKIMFE